MAKLEPAITTSLGQRARSLRKARGLTLATLSLKSGVSRASLSKIERGEMSPTYDILRKLANGLQVALTMLVLEEEASSETGLRILRAGDGATHHNPLYNYELLSGTPHLPGRKIYISEIGATDLRDFPALHSHESSDFLYVLSGRITAQFEHEEVFNLEVGDSLSFDGRIPHAFANSDPALEPAKVLWVSEPN